MVDAVDPVNPNYLGHVMAVAETQAVEASEDIVSGTGVKLVARGGRIDPGLRDRLLQHKLRKPLEETVRVVDGVVDGARMAASAERLMDTLPVLARLCGQGTPGVVELLRRKQMSPAMQSLLTVYAAHRENKLDHAVGVAMLAHGLSQALRGDIHQGRLLRQAGLLHDVGELYIEPALLAQTAPLTPDQWRHVAAHPIIAERLLKGLTGVLPEVALTVQQHHERLDGFGYPFGRAADKLGLPGQILSAAELLMGLLESGPRPLTRATIAMKLIPGEFAAALIDLIDGARSGEDAGDAAELTAQLAGASERVARIAQTLALYRTHAAQLEQAAAQSPPVLRQIIDAAVRRLQRIQVAFSSTGLDAHSPAEVLARLQALGDAATFHEVLTVLRELEWRLREIERESLMRAGLVAPAELPTLQRLVHLVRVPA